MLFKENDDARTILAAPEGDPSRIRAKNLIIWAIKSKRNGLSLTDFLDKAGRFGITSILVEGGSKLATSFLKAGLVDKHYVFVAPKVIGSGTEAVGELGIKKIADGIEYKNLTVSCDLSPDILITGYPMRKK